MFAVIRWHDFSVENYAYNSEQGENALWVQENSFVPMTRSATHGLSYGDLEQKRSAPVNVIWRGIISTTRLPDNGKIR